MIRDVSKNEVFQTLLFLPLGKSPGLDGLNVEFYRFFRDEVGDHLFSAINYFFSYFSLLNSWGRTYIMLIPKKSNSKLVYDFWPISLCNVSYKINSKLLANHLNHVLLNFISREQYGFVSGRNVFDNIIALQEITHSFNRELVSPRRVLVKIDIEKVYDTLTWPAILSTLTKMIFPSQWISWIEVCLSSVSYSLLINGQPTSWISSSRGVRQGNPISPYLFILVSQNFTALLNFALKNHMIPGFNSNLRQDFNHLMYADT